MNEDESSNSVDVMEDRECPECRGQCYDRHGNPCYLCFGEGVLDISYP